MPPAQTLAVSGRPRALRSSLGSLTALAIAASTLTFAGVVQVVQAPPAAAAAPPVVRGQVCGAGAAYGTVDYQNGVNGTLRCVRIFTGNGSTFTIPAGSTSVIAYLIAAGGGGAGGFLAQGSNQCTIPGSTGQVVPMGMTAGTTYTAFIGSGGSGGAATSADGVGGGAGGGGGATAIGSSSTSATSGAAGGTATFACDSDNGTFGSYFTQNGRSYNNSRSEWPNYGWGGHGWRRGSSGPSTGGTGQTGAAIVTLVPATPSAPRNALAVNDDTLGSITTSWTAPASDDSFVAHYVATATSASLTRTCTVTRTALSNYAIAQSCRINGLTAGDAYTITVQAYTALGASSPVSTSSSITVPDPPVNTSAPTIAGAGGKFAVGTPVTAGTGVWSGDTITGYGYQWQVCSAAADPSTCTDVVGATDDSYTPVLNDAGNYLRVGVTATNQYGSSSAFSVPSSAEQLTTTPAFLATTPPTLADVNRPYGSYAFSASGYRVAFAEDSAGLTGLPPGLTLNSAGVLSGTPTSRGTFTYRVQAINDSGVATTGDLTLTVSSGVASVVEIQQQPVGGPSRQLLTTQPVVRVLDDSGIVIRDDTIVVTSTGTIGGTQATGLATVNGVATFTNLTLAGLVDDTYTLTFSAVSSASATSEPTQVTPGLATALRIVTSPVAAPEAGDLLLTQPIINIVDADGNVVTYDDTTVVTLTPATGGFVGPTQASTVTAASVAGVASFAGVRFGGPVNTPIPLTFTANRDNVGPVLTDDSADVMSTASGPAYKLVVTTEATSPSPSGSAFAQPPIVERQDMAGNPVTADPQSVVTATLVGSAPPYVQLVGPDSQSTSSGAATFSSLGITGLAGSTYTLTFTSPGLVSAEDTVTLTTGAATQLSLTATGAQAPGNASYDDTALSPQPRVQLVDPGNNPVATAGVVVTASLVSGVGTLLNATATTDDSGLASFSNLQLDALTGAYVVRFSASTYASIDDTVLMLRGAQTITLAPISAKSLGDPTFTTSARTSSGLLVTFGTTTPAVCVVGAASTVVDDSTSAAVSILGAGTCTIVASQGGDANFEPAADALASFSVSKASQSTLTLVADETTVSAGQTVQLSTIGGSGTGAVTYARTSGSICDVDASTGVVTFTDTGASCDFMAAKADDTNYLSNTSAAVTITVLASGAGGLTPQVVAFTSTSPASPVEDDTYIASATSTSGLPVQIGIKAGSTGCSATPGPAPIEVTFTGSGTCILEATQPGDLRFDAAEPVEQTLRVYATAAEAAAGIRNQAISFDQPADRRLGTPNFALVATASSQLPVVFATTTAAVCTVTAGGIVHLISSGSCTVVANQAGNASYAMADSVTRTFLVTAGLPSAPRITSVATGSGSATLTFAAPNSDGGSPLIGYVVVAIPVGQGSVVSSDSCTASPCTITGLATGITYTLQMGAINAVGTGPYSTATTAVTPQSCTLCVGAPGAAPGAPGAPVGDRVDDTSVTLEWSQPIIMADDTFTSYDVYYRPSGATWPSTPYERIMVITTTSTTIVGLTPGVVYEFLVVVVTTSNPQQSPPDADAPNATTIVVGTPTAPTVPRDLTVLYVTDTSIEVSWAFSASDGGSPITAYSVSLSGGAACAAPILDDTTATATCPASGLRKGTTYTVTLSARNAIGSSPEVAVSYTTPGIPDPDPTPPPNPPGPPTPPPNPPGPQPVPQPVTPGEVEVVVDGMPIPVDTSPSEDLVAIVGDDRVAGGGPFSLSVGAYVGKDRLPLGPGDVVTAMERSQVGVAGSGYAPLSRVSIYIGGQPMVLLGSTRTTVMGTFDARFALPSSITAGDYTLQVNGYNRGANIRSVNVGMTVIKVPWIKISGKRNGSVSRVVGTSGELSAGTVVIPMVKIGKAKEFTQGTGARAVHADGSFEWQRKVGKGRPLWVYFAVVPIKSNTLALALSRR